MSSETLARTSTRSSNSRHQRNGRPYAYAPGVSWRAIIVTGVLIGLSGLVAWWNLITGTSTLTATETIRAVFGEGDEGTLRVVTQWRMPRIVFDLLAGAALAMSGAIFQSITRNPLGSPDIMGIGVGAYTGVLIVTVLGFTGMWSTPAGALIGGLGVGALIYFLSWRGGVSGIRLILVGIGLSILLSSFNTYLITTLSLEVAISASIWGAGSVNDITWMQVMALVIVGAIVLPVIVLIQRPLTLLEMGEDSARGIGINTQLLRIAAVCAAVILVALVTAAAGPIAFVALVAPQIARRLTRQSGVQFLPAAAMGALLLTGADVITRSSWLPWQPAVGIVTLILGGIYLLWLLITSRKKGA